MAPASCAPESKECGHRRDACPGRRFPSYLDGRTSSARKPTGAEQLRASPTTGGGGRPLPALVSALRQSCPDLPEACWPPQPVPGQSQRQPRGGDRRRRTVGQQGKIQDHRAERTPLCLRVKMGSGCAAELGPLAVTVGCWRACFPPRGLSARGRPGQGRPSGAAARPGCGRSWTLGCPLARDGSSALLRVSGIRAADAAIALPRHLLAQRPCGREQITCSGCFSGSPAGAGRGAGVPAGSG